ncbi:hypothetical protein HUN92_17460 [Bacillus firmus]|uniref:hypothetical protein n=1 Tax=Cytobacillus firmus TaxID=1399 RepID=UPI0015802D8F|nr:hypothetical protein [Cytobacillus firmus]NUH85485.1 hypothetical protein [Cytobacillus firmus]
MENDSSRKILGSVWFWIAVAGVVMLCGVFYFIGSYTAKVDLHGKKASLDELVKKIEEREVLLGELKNKTESQTKEVADIQKEIQEMEKEKNEALTIIENNSRAEEEMKELHKQVEKSHKELSNLTEGIKAKKAELAAVEGEIIEKKQEPKVLPAGFFTVGKDLQAGRYKVVAQSGFGNFFVNSGSKVNIILGDSEIGVNEYVFFADEGDEIELTLTAKFIPVE